MRKRVVLALMLVAAMILATGCSLIVKDAEVDKQTVIVDVNGKTFTKGEVEPMVENVLNNQEYMYRYYYGMDFDRTDSAVISAARDSAIQSLVRQTVVEQKCAETGADAFSEEELAKFKADAEATYQTYVDAVKNAEFAATELTGEALDAAISARMAELGYPTLEEVERQSRTTAATAKLKADVVKELAVTEEEIKAEYDTRAAAAKTEYESTPAAYGSAVQNGSVVYYTPAGYRYVKHILRSFAEADQTKISELASQLTDKQTQLRNVESSLADLGEDAAQDDEQTAQSRKELTDTQTALTGEIAQLETQADAAREAGYAALQPTVDEIQAKLAQGQDFDALMAEYGQDPGMENEPFHTTGYLVCESSANWVAEFTAASMSLAKVGDVSEPVKSSSGVHIIKYVGDAVEGAANYDDVKDTISAELLSAKQDESYNSAVEQWVTDAKAKIYKDRLE